VERHDEIDFGSQISEEEIELSVRGTDGGVRVVQGVREYGVPFGVEFEARQPKRCHNNCVFCFVYQHPKGVRRELLIKDDDYVFSFVHGNFITLTNLSEADFQRIIDGRLSPLYVSVHATDPDVRVRMMKNPKSGQILAQIDRLAEAGIDMHTQLVVCPGLNDDEVLRRSIRELGERHPRVATIAVVPVGLTKHRARLPELRPFRPEDARTTLREVRAFQDEFRRRGKSRIVFAADELYVLAGEPVPAAREYEGFPQLENGIGMLRETIDRWTSGADGIRPQSAPGERVVVVTGASAGPTIQHLLEAKPPSDVRASVCVVRNDYFGERALRDHGPGDRVVLPPNCLKQGEIFLDDMPRAELERRLGVPVGVGFDASEAASAA
jgi:putative radical SAM enzyme (TIGR03279 family)